MVCSGVLVWVIAQNGLQRFYACLSLHDVAMVHRTCSRLVCSNDVLRCASSMIVHASSRSMHTLTMHLA